MQKFLNWLYLLNWTLLVAGFAGGTAYVLNQRNELTAWRKVAAIVTGVLASYYCSAWLAGRAGAILGALLAPAGTIPVPVFIPEGLAGFACGVCGQIIVVAFIDYATNQKNKYVPSPPKTDHENPVK